MQAGSELSGGLGCVGLGTGDSDFLVLATRQRGWFVPTYKDLDQIYIDLLSFWGLIEKNKEPVVAIYGTLALPGLSNPRKRFLDGLEMLLTLLKDASGDSMVFLPVLSRSGIVGTEVAVPPFRAWP